MTKPSNRSLAAFVAIAALGAGGAAPAAYARHGADDTPAHKAADDKGGKRVKAKAARHGADDPAGDDRGGRGRGRDDGPNHR
jgi:hypothetical protein